MVVIIIIGIVAALAVPTMAAARIDRNAYDDAGQIMQLFREARTRAVARGGAVLISMTANGPTDRGTFTMYESVTVEPGAASAGTTAPPSPRARRRRRGAPLNATNPGIVLVDGAEPERRPIEQSADIETQLNVYNPAGAVDERRRGRLHLLHAARPRLLHGSRQPVFDGMLPMLSPLEFRVTRRPGGTPVGTIRSVLLPPNGMARVFSHIP